MNSAFIGSVLMALGAVVRSVQQADRWDGLLDGDLRDLEHHRFARLDEAGESHPREGGVVYARVIS
jgi:hypothetical protein